MNLRTISPDHVQVRRVRRQGEDLIHRFLGEMGAAPSISRSSDAIRELGGADLLRFVDRLHGEGELARGVGGPAGRDLSQTLNLRQQLWESEAHRQDCSNTCSALYPKGTPPQIQWLTFFQRATSVRLCRLILFR